jgi:hypothetical protein
MRGVSAHMRRRQVPMRWCGDFGAKGIGTDFCVVRTDARVVCTGASDPCTVLGEGGTCAGIVRGTLGVIGVRPGGRGTVASGVSTVGEPESHDSGAKWRAFGYSVALLSL